MKLEGSLDAFSLPEILQLLTVTKKSGGLHLVRAPQDGTQHAVIRLADGAIAGATSDISRQSLVRRLVASGHLADAAFTNSVERARVDRSVGLARAVAETGEIDATVLHSVAREHTVDALFDIMWWSHGTFTFLFAEADPDDIGLRVPAADLLIEAGQRAAEWPAMSGLISTPDVVLGLTPAPAQDPTLTREEWALVALIDGRRTIGDLMALCGRGESAVVAVLSPLLERGLLMVPDERTGEVAAALVRRQELIATLETHAGPRRASPFHHAPDLPPPAVIPSPARPMDEPRYEPVLEPRYERNGDTRVEPLLQRHARLEPEPADTVDNAAASPAPPVDERAAPAERPQSRPIEADQGINRSMVLRLIAGVQEL